MWKGRVWYAGGFLGRGGGGLRFCFVGLEGGEGGGGRFRTGWRLGSIRIQRRCGFVWEEGGMLRVIVRGFEECCRHR